MAASVCILISLLLVSSHLTTPSFAVSEDAILLQFREALENASALDATWRAGTNHCDWRGIECDQNRKVTGLILVNLGLSGTSLNINITSLAQLDKLRFISLENNSFSGPLPLFNRLTSLKSLYLAGNAFSGEILPGYFRNMGSLKNLELSRNKFSGRIPVSVMELNHLGLLLLDNNGFTGPVLLLTQPTLERIDFSNNRLQGEIPQAMSKFGQSSFAGNVELCGIMISRPCQPPNAPPPTAPVMLSDPSSGALTRWVILSIVVAVLLMTIFFTKTNKGEQNFSVLGKESVDDVVELHIPGSARKSMGMGMGSSRKVGLERNQSSRPALSTKHDDLVMVNEEKGIFGLQDLMKAAAEVLGNGSVGSAYKAVMSDGVAVAVKRFKDMDRLQKDAFGAEVRRLGRIKHRNILPLLAYHYRKEEKLLVSEFVPKGSLLYLLHGDRGTEHNELTWPIRLKIIKGVARGLGFLHTEFTTYEVPHGNLKSSNILISSSYEPLLTDYGLCGLVSNSHSGQSLFCKKCPEVIMYHQLTPKCDVYCLGIVILEIMTGKCPSQYLNNQKGGTDVVEWARQVISEDRSALELIDPEIANKTDSLTEMEKMLKIGAACTESDHTRRPEMKEAIRSIEEVQA